MLTAPSEQGEIKMALSFLKYGVTPQKRNNRKAEPTVITWDELSSHFNNLLSDNPEKLIRETKWSRRNNPQFPMEARMMFGNANVPMGYYGGNTKNHLVKSIPCNSMAQGKKQLKEFIEAIESDIETQQVVARFLKNQKSFDYSSIPSSILES